MQNFIIDPPFDSMNEIYYRLDESVKNSDQPQYRTIIVRENLPVLGLIKEEEEGGNYPY
jgi:hypothetical protein